MSLRDDLDELDEALYDLATKTEWKAKRKAPIVIAETNDLTGGSVISGVGSTVASRPTAMASAIASIFPASAFVGPGVATTDFDWRIVAPNKAFRTANIYYVDVTGGSDAAAGTSWATAFKSIWKATTAGNTSAAPFVVYIAAGEYERSNAFCNAGSAVIPTQECAYIAVGGRVIAGTWGALTWTLTGGTTYQVSRTNVRRVLDWLNKDEHGDFVELPKVADLATCQATPGSWYTDGTIAYVNRADGAAVTTANTKALLQAVDGFVMTTTGNMYLEGIDQLGGNQGGYWVKGNATGIAVTKDCSFKFSSAATPIDGVQVLDVKGYIGINTTAAKNGKDGFNFHKSGVTYPYCITVGCIGRNNGDGNTSSNNGLTLHDGCKGIDIGGKYYGNRGGNIAITNAGTELWAVGTSCWGSLGDIGTPGGATPPCDYQAIDSAVIYKTAAVGFSTTVDRLESGGSIVES